ncbi:MAG: hypothetical protein B6229_04015 [Spirochaetaceae bacterium 4572_7]|nr:MAG: hypothetical protein B6229_04015 [Spirochaetaceae bacterium 4572_7]
MTISEDTTMFSWKGVNKVGSDFIPQKIKCYFENRNFVWEFENFFIPEDFSLNSIKLKGKSKLIPNKWNHHLVRYDSQTGLLEYLMNGEAEDVVYTTPSGREESIIYPPYTGNFSKKSIYLGERFRGFIDELRISESFVSEPNISKFESYGSFKTAVYDLDGQDVVLNNITFKEVEKPETLIKYSYRFLTEPFLEHNLDIPWQTMNDIKNKDHGRYIQIKGELFSNGGTDISPRVESINIHWDLIPPPPTPNFKSITALPSSVKIEWSSVKHCNVEGYLLYYGRESDNYEEVIDVGKETSYTINSLVSNDIYYFSIRAYLDNQKSEFSNEIYCRAK